MTLVPDKWRLLLVDDKEDIRDVLTIALNHLVYSVRCAKDINEALCLLKDADQTSFTRGIRATACQ